MRLRVICRLVLVLALVAVPARAGIVVFGQGPVNGSGSLISDFGWGQQGLDDFFFGGPYLTITDFHWWGSYGSAPDPAPSDSFILRFFADTGGGVPAVAPFHTSTLSNFSRTLTALTSSAWGLHDGGPVYRYSADLDSPLTVLPFTTYFASVVNSTSSTWGWLEDGPGAGWWRLSDGSPWLSTGTGHDLSFEITAVPEPGSAMLLLGGLGCLALRRRRRS